MRKHTGQSHSVIHHTKSKEQSCDLRQNVVEFNIMGRKWQNTHTQNAVRKMGKKKTKHAPTKCSFLPSGQ